MRRYRFSMFGSIIVLVTCSSFLSQAQPQKQPQIVTLYSPLTHKQTSAPPFRNGTLRPDSSRAEYSFTLGRFTLSRSAELSWGFIQIGDGPDWFMLQTSDDSRSVIRDLGDFQWTDKFDVPALKPLPLLAKGKHRQFSYDTSGRNGDDGTIVRGVQSAAESGNEIIMNRDSDQTVVPSLPDAHPVRNAGNGKPKLNPPGVSAETRLGHMYLIRIVDAKSDYYVLMHVDALTKHDSCTISWERIPSPNDRGR